MTVHASSGSGDESRPVITSTTGPGSAAQLALLRVIARTCGVLPGEAAPRWTRRGTAAMSKVFSIGNAARYTVFGNRILQVGMGDRYWMPGLLAGIPYEPEMLRVLRRLLHPSSVFIDCGANIGYWSVYASTVILDPSRILAIEPEQRAFMTLEANRVLNQERFQVLKAAVSDDEREAVDLLAAPNRPASSVLVEHEEAAGSFSTTERVRSRRLDSIIDERFPTGADRVVAKLDVEGAESRALRGAGPYLNHLAAIVYEDHGRDLSCAPSRDLLEQGFAIWAPESGGQFRRMQSVEQIVALKRDPGRGYNFVAVRPHSEAQTALEQGDAG